MKTFDPFAGWLRWACLWLAVIAIGLVMLGWGIARAQHPGHAEHHAWYEHLKTPQGYQCCDNRDCRPVRARPLDDGSWEAFFGGEWRPVPAERILPDHLNKVPTSAHICEQDGFTRCFLRGGAGI
jgi:hypothetical protein